ncbi:MAG: hypothetical protein ACRELA_00790 [Candidatus Rokuibacteriota bacterium]
MVGGVIAPVIETTAQVLGNRRLRLLRDLSAQALECRTDDEACDTVARILAANAADVPFSLLYLMDRDGQHATLVRSTGFDGGATPAPDITEIETGPSAGDGNSNALERLLVRVARRGSAGVLTNLEECGSFPGGPWPEPARSAVVLPIVSPGQAALAGLLVAGASPRRELDDEYRGFFDLLA